MLGTARRSAGPAPPDLVPDGVYVTHVRPGYERLIGARVLRIGTEDLDVALRRAGAALSHENSERLQANAPWLVTYPSALHALGLAASPHTTVWSFVQATGDTIEVDLAPADESAASWVPAVRNPPLYQRRTDQAYWFEHIDGALYLRYRAARDPVAFWRFARRVDAVLDSVPTREIIVDVRGNGGGNSLQFEKLLLSKLRNRSARHFYAITDRSTFSAAVSNVVAFRRATGALFVGEPPGMAPNAYGEVEEFRLPHSGIAVRYATKFVMSDSTFGTARSLPMDVPISVTAQQYFAGTDPVMEYLRQ